MSNQQTNPEITLRKERYNDTFLLGTAFIFAVFLFLIVIAKNKESVEQSLFFALLCFSSIAFLRMLFHVSGAIIFSALKRKQKFDPSFTPGISIIIPAYNEGVVIKDVLKNFMYIDYPTLEIILVDDGSSDNTFNLAKDTAHSLNLDIKVYSKPNGGKASALNYGIEHSQYEYIFCMDADSILTTNSLREGIKHFQNNQNLAAVAGVVKVANDNTFLGRLQSLDYLLGHFQRKMLSVFKKVTIVPGPVGLFKKDLVLNIGGYEKEDTTFAEDTELTLRLLANGHDIICEDKMIAFTEAPTIFNNLYRQRYRWTRGIFQALVKNSQLFLGSDRPSNILIFMYMMWEQAIIPIIDFALLIVFVFYFLINETGHTYSYFFLYIFIIDFIFVFGATLKEPKKIKYYFHSFLSRLTFTNILSVWKMISLLDEWTSKKMSWDKLERNGLENSIMEVRNS